MKEIVYSFYNKVGDTVIDTPIYIDACGNNIYIHIISREIHSDVVDRISKDVHFGFDK